MRHLSPFYSRDLVNEMIGDFDGIVNSLLRPSYASTVGFRPSSDIRVTNDHYLVSFDMPGVKKEDIKIEVQSNQLVITGERSRQEGSYGTASYHRTFMLPDSIDTSKVEAHYEDGVLNIAIPKAESAKARTIEIQSGKGGFFSKLLGSKNEEPKELKDVKIS